MGKRNYTKKYYKSKYSGGSSRWQIYGKAAGQLAKDAMKGVQLVKSLINTEFKNVDTNGNVTAIAGGTLQLVNPTSMGSGQNNREGSSFRMKSVLTRFRITVNATAPGYQTCRCLLVLDQQPNGTVFGITDLLATNTIDSPRNLDYRKRFKILYDKNFCVSANRPQIFDQIYQKFDSKVLSNQAHVQCYATSNLGTIADISTNALYMVFLSDQGVNGPTMDYYTRVRFLDN